VETYQLIPNFFSARNPQANSILEHIHRNIGDYIWLTQMNELELPDKDPFYGLLNSITLAVLKQFYVEILLGSTSTALSSLIRPCKSRPQVFPR
jgi:hypothetical protein